MGTKLCITANRANLTSEVGTLTQCCVACCTAVASILSMFWGVEMTPAELIARCQDYAVHCWLTDKQTLIDIAQSCLTLAARVRKSKSLFELSEVTDCDGPRTIH
jgi:hypothetical protein